MSIVVRPWGKSVRVLKYNERCKMWQPMATLEDQVVFLSSTSCIAMSYKELGGGGVQDRLNNTIHFPRFHGRHNVFYSPSTAKFHSLGGDYASDDDLLDTNLPLNCTWISSFEYFSDRQLDWEELPNPDEREVVVAEELVVVKQESSSPIGKPWIVMCHGGKGEKQVVTFVDLANDVYYSTQYNEIDARLRGKKVYARGYGRVLLMNLEARDCVLLNTMSMAFHQLPTWEKRENYFIYRCSLLYLPADGDDSKLMVMVFGVDAVKGSVDGTGVAMLYGVGDKEWTIIEGGVRVTGVGACQGKICAVGAPPREQFQFFEIKLQPRYTVKLVKNVDVPKFGLPGCCDIRRYFVDSCDELLLFHVSLAGDPYANEDANIIVGITVFRIDVKTMRLEEVEDLGDRVFFLSWSAGMKFFGSGGFGCCASKSGFKRNTIYVVNSSDSNLYVYDYGDRSVSVTLSCPEVQSCSMHAIVMCP